MNSASRRTWVSGILAFLVQAIHGAPSALSVTPSTTWYGVDGTWSAISIQLGTPPQWIDVMVSTVSSETWVGASTACAPDGYQCIAARGKLFDLHNSSTWQPYGDWSLSVDSQLGNNGYAEYGLDNLTFGSTGVSLPSAIIGAYNATGPINGTLYQLGLFGLGIVPGKFPPHNSPVPAINALVEQLGAIPSHSYGYTAGATYRQKGTPNSLTLGGYDANRFVNHSISYSLNIDRNPEVYINSISATSSNFTTPAQLLLQSDRVSAIIDSSTPYLWLPQAVCERFASYLGLTYNDTLNLYTFDGNATQRNALVDSSLSFTFSITDLLSSPKVVNITLPYDAFNLQLTYPAIPGTAYQAADSTKWYFPLRQASDEAQYTIGRAFLQEAYIITDYERNTFSVHQAVHTSDPLGDTSIWSILPYENSTLSGAPHNKSGSKVPIGAIIGSIVGAAVVVALILSIYLYLRRQKTKKQDHSEDEKSVQSPPRTFLDLILGRHPHPNVSEFSGSSSLPHEVGADATHERFELAAPLGPAELDSEYGTLEGSTQNGSTENSENLSAYERARRKLERQQIAAAHAQAVMESYPIEKNETDVSRVAHYRVPDTPESERPLVSPIGPGPESGGSLTISDQPSPVSPGFVSSPSSPIGPMPPMPMEPPPSYRRFNPENVVYVGRLPDNIQLPPIVPRIIGPDGRTVRPEETNTTHPGGTNSSLGSHYTENEEGLTDLYGSGGTNLVSPVLSGSSGSGSGSGNSGTNIVSPINSGSIGSGSGSHPNLSMETDSESASPHSPRTGVHLREGSDPWSSRRRLHGEDLVHVPQPAENRFSWEEERISGNDSL